LGTIHFRFLDASNDPLHGGVHLVVGEGGFAVAEVIGPRFGFDLQLR
jgi:hypothetical protein